MDGKLLKQGVSYLRVVGSTWHDSLQLGKSLYRGQSNYTFGDKTEQVSSLFRAKQQIDILVTKKRQFGNSKLEEFDLKLISRNPSNPKGKERLTGVSS